MSKQRYNLLNNKCYKKVKVYLCLEYIYAGYTDPVTGGTGPYDLIEVHGSHVIPELLANLKF